MDICFADYEIELSQMSSGFVTTEFDIRSMYINVYVSTLLIANLSILIL